jgi:hypothetical protein
LLGGIDEWQEAVHMSVATVRTILVWSAVINYAILLLWFLVFRFAHDWMYRVHSRWFRLSMEQFDAAHYAAMSIYKIGILLFNLVPYVAILIAI